MGIPRVLLAKWAFDRQWTADRGGIGPVTPGRSESREVRGAFLRASHILTRVRVRRMVAAFCACAGHTRALVAVATNATVEPFGPGVRGHRITLSLCASLCACRTGTPTCACACACWRDRGGRGGARPQTAVRRTAVRRTPVRPPARPPTILPLRTNHDHRPAPERRTAHGRLREHLATRAPPQRPPLPCFHAGEFRRLPTLGAVVAHLINARTEQRQAACHIRLHLPPAQNRPRSSRPGLPPRRPFESKGNVHLRCRCHVATCCRPSAIRCCLRLRQPEDHSSSPPLGVQTTHARPCCCLCPWH